MNDMWDKSDTSFANEGGFVKNDANAAKGGSGFDSTKQKKIAAVNSNQIRLQTSSNHGLVLHRQKFNTLTILGRVLSASETTTKCNYIIQDHTGAPLDVQLWRAGETIQDVPEIQKDQYVRVIGHSRKTAGASDTYIVAYAVKPVTDPNEVTLHLIETIFTALVCKKKKNNIVAQIGITDGFPGGVPAILRGQPVTTHAAPVTQTASQVGGVSGMSPSHQLVLKAIQGCHSNYGIAFDDLCKAIGSVPPNAIRKAVEFLSQEGHIYTTMDDDHFKATDG